MSAGLDAAREHRDDLEALADSDLPAAWVAQAILDATAEQAAEDDYGDTGDSATR